MRLGSDGVGLAASMRESDHLLFLALQRIEHLVRRGALRQRLLGADPEDPYRGLLLSDQEVDQLIQSLPNDFCCGLSHPALDTVNERLRALEHRLERLDPSCPSRLRNLLTALELGPFDRDVLLLALLSEIEPRYGRLFGFLHDDVTQRLPTVALALNLLCEGGQSRHRGRTHFLPQAPLRRHLLVRLLPPQHGAHATRLRKAIQIDQHVADYLLGLTESDAQLSSFAYAVEPRPETTGLAPKETLTDRVLDRARGPVVFCLKGGPGLGKREAALAVSQQLGRDLMVVDVRRMLDSDLPFATALILSLRQALLKGAILYWDRVDAVSDDEARRHQLLDSLKAYRQAVFIAGEEDWVARGLRPDLTVIEVPFPVPEYRERKRLWEIHLDGNVLLDDDVDAGVLANRFRFGEGQIRDVVATSRDLALASGAERVDMSHLFEACRAHSNQRLTHLAQKVEPHYGWKDIVLPLDQIRQLREIISYVRYRPLVYDDWGFDRKLSLSKGVNILFVGGPGTGKTMAADIIAGELELDLYKIDLSMVVSKYIGETEKNLSKIFKEAATSNSILFFDEADAIFGKRSEVRDSHDRYANIEIAYLLQKMEEYVGIVVLATNMRQSLDDAFVRRMHVTLEFPFPEEEYRRRIWEVTFPREAPRSEAVDLDFMARQFKVAGGNIRNIILSAAFLAAGDGQVISMEHLIRATKREFQKMGKLVVDGDFGPYYDLLENEREVVCTRNVPQAS
jgi:SpoVK/Ycf46/Vps4 family AAA+-type ATPase